MMFVSVAMVGVGVVGGADVFHSVDAAAFGAALDGAVAGHLVGGGGVSDVGMGGEGERGEGGWGGEGRQGGA